MDETGAVRGVRDLNGKPVSQVLLGGDSGSTLRDLFAAAALLKSKRVPARVEFLLAVPSRQMLEVLAGSGALTDLIATGARLIEPDARVMSGELYPPAPAGLSARTHDLEPSVTMPKNVAIASAETLAYAVATGEMGDPRTFKRPVRVTIPRALPTDDVLVVRDRKGALDAGKKAASLTAPAPTPWKTAQTLDVVEGLALLSGKTAPAPAVAPASGAASGAGAGANPIAVVCSTLDEVRELAARAVELSPGVRAVVAPFIPSGAVALFSGVGIAAFRVDAAGAKGLKGQRTMALPPPAQWSDKEPTVAVVGSQKVPLTWLALGPERGWVTAGTSRPAPRTRS
jgi:aconitate hydratase